MKKIDEKINRKFSFTNRFLTGIVIALAASLTAFEWTTVTTEPIIFKPSGEKDIPEIMEPLRFKIKDLEKPKPKTNTDVIKLVEDIPEKIDEPDPEPKPIEKNDFIPQDIDLDDYGMDDSDFIDKDYIYTTVQIFAHYDECAHLEGEELKQCAQIAIMNAIKEKFEISRQLKDVGGRQAVKMNFVVDESGKISNINVDQATSKYAAKDAIKALEKLPAMNPAIQQGRKVKLRMSIPIIINL